MGRGVISFIMLVMSDCKQRKKKRIYEYIIKNEKCQFWTQLIMYIYIKLTFAEKIFSYMGDELPEFFS